MLHPENVAAHPSFLATQGFSFPGADMAVIHFCQTGMVPDLPLLAQQPLRLGRSKASVSPTHYDSAFDRLGM